MESSCNLKYNFLKSSKCRFFREASITLTELIKDVEYFMRNWTEIDEFFVACTFKELNFIFPLMELTYRIEPNNSNWHCSSSSSCENRWTEMKWKPSQMFKILLQNNAYRLLKKKKATGLSASQSHKKTIKKERKESKGKLFGAAFVPISLIVDMLGIFLWGKREGKKKENSL